jgi:hypothetical protein
MDQQIARTQYLPNVLPSVDDHRTSGYHEVDDGMGVPINDAGGWSRK